MSGTRNPRVLLRQFGETANLADLAVFGSEAAGTPESMATGGVVDPHLMQSLSQWLDGWASSILGGGNPTLEDFNTAFYVFCYHLKYLLRSGVAEWDSETEYFNGDLVKLPGVPPPGIPGLFGSHIVYVCISDSASSSVGETPASNPQSWKVWRDDTQPKLNPQANTTLATRAVTGWTSKSAPARTWTKAAFSPELGLWCVVAGAGTHRSMTSSDGNTWTEATDAVADAGSWLGLCWAAELGLFVAVGSAGSIMTSPDGAVWTSRTSPNAIIYSSVCWSAELGLLVAVAKNGTAAQDVITSSDGITWTAHTAASAELWFGVTWCDSIALFVAVAAAGGAATFSVMTSPDGITWTGRSGPSLTNNWSAVKWAPEIGIVVAISTSGASRISWSRDGINWNNVVAPEANSWNDLDWSPEIGMFVAVSSDGTHRVMYSRDGVSWTTATAAAANDWFGIAWGSTKGKFAAFSQTGANQAQVSRYVRKFVA